MEKDYFKYNNGKIEYEKSLKDKLKETFVYVRENKKLPPNESLLSLFYYAEPSKVFTIKNIVRGLLVVAILATISISIHIFKSAPQINVPIQNGGVVSKPTTNNSDIITSTLHAIEKEEVSFYQNYLDGKISGAYAKNSAVRFASSKNQLLTEALKDTSLESLITANINDSINYSNALIDAISSYDNVLIKELIDTKFHPYI